MKNNAQIVSEILNNPKLTVLEKTLIRYLLTCPEAKNTIDEIADDFLLLPSELFRELQVLEKQGYLKIKIELPSKE